LYRKAVKKAIQLFQAQYSMANCVRLACKDTGYPVKARVDRGFRSLLSEAELEERRMSAKSAHGFSSKPMTQSARSIYREIKVNESHFRDIVES
jgi:hypothetical protein